MSETAPARPFVALRGIIKRFGDFVANDGIDLSIASGQIHALLGENGAGKSTLMKILCGIIQPDAGTVTIDGVPTMLANPAAARAAGIAMVFQHFALFDALTVLENIAVTLPRGRAGRGLRAELAALAARFGLAIELDRPVWALSAGERQRVEILRALVVAPRLLILDEPTSVLTPPEVEGLFATLERLAGGGTAILFISHKLAEVRRLCSSATVLRAGRVVGTADPRIASAADLAAMMVGTGADDGGAIVPDSPSGAPLLVVSGLSKAATRPGGVALSAIGLTVCAGEIVVIVGVAGNGQGELFAAIAGEEGPPDAGQIALCGTPATALDINGRRRLGAAFVPEDRLGHASVPDAPLSENVLLTWHAIAPLARPFIARRRLVEIAGAIVADNDVRVPRQNPNASQLSGGNLQKFIVGREIARAPRLIVVDQPTWGVDVKASARIRQALVTRARAGGGVLVITQDLDEAFDIATRIAVLHHGHLSPPQARAEADRQAVGLLMTDRDSHDAAREAAAEAAA